MSEATIEQVRTVARNGEVKKYMKELIESLEKSYKNTPENVAVRHFLRGKIEAYNDIVKRLY